MRETNVSEQRRMRQWVLKVSAHMGQLDILVEDVFCKRANRVNNNLRKQVAFLLRHMSPKQFKRAVRHELGILRDYRMQSQSKMVAEKNVRLKRHK